MLLAKVTGQVVATQKDGKLKGRKLSILRPLQVDEQGNLVEGKSTVVALDSLGAGEGQVVLFCQGSSARQGEGLKEVPVDAAVVGIVDSIDVMSKTLYKSGNKQ